MCVGFGEKVCFFFHELILKNSLCVCSLLHVLVSVSMLFIAFLSSLVFILLCIFVGFFLFIFVHLLFGAGFTLLCVFVVMYCTSSCWFISLDFANFVFLFFYCFINFNFFCKSSQIVIL